MTTTDTDRDFAAICAAIDGGDYTALCPLADLLEERGDQRAKGLARIASEAMRLGDYRPVRRPGELLDCPGGTPVAFGWVMVDDTPWYCSEVTEREFGLMGPSAEQYYQPTEEDGPMVAWGRRSAAFLALAEALVRELAAT